MPAGEHHPDRAAEFTGGHGGQDDIGPRQPLGAEPAADVRTDHPDPFHRQAQRTGDRLPDGMAALIRVVQRQVAVGEHRGGGVRFHRVVVLGRGAIGRVQLHRAAGESPVRVAHLAQTGIAGIDRFRCPHTRMIRVEPHVDGRVRRTSPAAVRRPPGRSPGELAATSATTSPRKCTSSDCSTASIGIPTSVSTGALPCHHTRSTPGICSTAAVSTSVTRPAAIVDEHRPGMDQILGGILRGIPGGAGDLLPALHPVQRGVPGSPAVAVAVATVMPEATLWSPSRCHPRADDHRDRRRVGKPTARHPDCRPARS